jgi:hypothetical protein
VKLEAPLLNFELRYWKTQHVYNEYLQAPLLLQIMIRAFYENSMSIGVDPVFVRILEKN